MMFSSIMAKKSYKQRSKSEKVHVGCMSGLIHMFDFRHSPKLISDGSHVIRRNSVRSDLKGSEDFHGIVSSDEDKDYGVKTICAGRASIKALMEEEMASGTQILKETQMSIFAACSDNLKYVNLWEGSDIGLDLAASLMELYRKHNGGHDVTTLEGSGHSSNLIDKENNTDAGIHLKRIPSSIEKALEAVAEAVISHQSANRKFTSSSSSSEARSKEFVDALQLLSSNEQLFLMLLQDPSSRLLQCLQDLYTSLGSSKLELTETDRTNLKVTSKNLLKSEVSNYEVRNGNSSFLKEDNIVMRRPPNLNNSPRGLSRIVVLKPSPAKSQTSLNSSSAISSPLSNHYDLQGQEDSDKLAPHFSLGDLRRLRLAISKDQNDNMSSTFHKNDPTKQFLLKSMSSSMPSIDSSDSEKVEKPSIVDKKTNPEDSGSGMGNDANHCANSSTHCANSFSYEKAKKHLIERLDNQRDDSSQMVHKSETFGRLISYSEYDTFSPTRCPQEDINLSQDSTHSSVLLTTKQEDNSANSNPPRKFLELILSDASTLANTLLDGLKTGHGSHQLKECAISQKLISGGINSMNDAIEIPKLSVEIENSSESLEQINAEQCFVEEPQSMNALSEVSLYSPENLVNGQDSSSPSAIVALAKPSILTFSCSTENADDKEERLSPQSVLDSFSGNVNSNYKTQKQDELSMPSSKVLFKESDTPSVSPTLHNTTQGVILDDKQATISFINVVLEASDLLSEGSSERWYVDGSLLDTSVLAEVGNLYCLTDDAVLLFDCVEEALFKTRDNFFGSDPWVAYLKHNVRPAPVGVELVREVSKFIDSLVSNEFPSTLDHVVLKDLESGSWMDLRCDTEDAVIEVWDGLLDDLLEEIVFDLWL